MSGAARFTCEARSGPARAGRLVVRGKTLRTPAFLPVGTYGSVKAASPELLATLGAELLLANACHLHDRPGEALIAELGGLHRFMNWNGLLLTDSGGFQVFSLLDSARIDERGVTFRSPVDGRALRLGPEEAVDIQLALDSDIAMVFDDCPPLPAPRERLQAAVARTQAWAETAVARHAARSERGQALFGIVQGGLDDELRANSARGLRELPLDGWAVGGLSVGESRAELHRAMHAYAPLLPEASARYVMGVGRPADVLEAIAAGFDMFDSVLPTRNARHGTLFTRRGLLNLRLAAHRRAPGPIEEECDCPACRGWSLAALRHMQEQGDPLAHMLCTAHNLRHLHRLVAEARTALLEGRFEAWRAQAAPVEA